MLQGLNFACFQDSTSKENSTVNSEFENMWKDMLKGSSGGESSQGSSLSQAAASLPTVPSTATDNKNKNKNNNETASTKIDVENLFSQASKAQGNDEFSAMFKSLELSNQQKAKAKDDSQELGEVYKNFLELEKDEIKHLLNQTIFLLGLSVRRSLAFFHQFEPTFIC